MFFLLFSFSFLSDYDRTVFDAEGVLLAKIIQRLVWCIYIFFTPVGVYVIKLRDYTKWPLRESSSFVISPPPPAPVLSIPKKRGKVFLSRFFRCVNNGTRSPTKEV